MAVFRTGVSRIPRSIGLLAATLAAVALSAPAQVKPTYPGVYVEEVPSGVRTIMGVSTCITAFVGCFSRGPVDEPVRVFSFEDFEREFGGLAAESEASYAVHQFFLNGGFEAWIVRTVGDNPAPTCAFAIIEDCSRGAAFEIRARNPGAWGNSIRVRVNDSGSSSGELFDLVISLLSDPADPLSEVKVEAFSNLSMNETNARYVTSIINATSRLVEIVGPVGTKRPVVTGTPLWELTMGTDGSVPAPADLIGDSVRGTGIYALDDVDLVNILCIPRLASIPSAEAVDVVAAACAYCEERRAFFIVDPPSDVVTMEEIKGWVDEVGRSANAAIYYPKVRVADPLDGYQLRAFGSSGAIAGIYASIDANRGVWTAAAGPDATLANVSELEALLTDAESEVLNSVGINCLRDFPVDGIVCWGARTLDGNDLFASEWKYVPVRRLALYIEESLLQGTKWAACEPNVESLWEQIRLNVGAFMNNLFRVGAFQGSSPEDAFWVKCDAETTTQSDIDQGVLNVLVGFAPTQPGEFVFLKITQTAQLP